MINGAAALREPDVEDFVRRVHEHGQKGPIGTAAAFEVFGEGLGGDEKDRHSPERCALRSHRPRCVGPVEVNARGPRSVGPGHGEEREEPVALGGQALVVPEEVAGEGLPLDVRGLLQVERGGGQALLAAPVGRVGHAAGRRPEAARPVEDDPAIGQRAGAGVLLRKSS